jgi:hypothetical protein
MAQGVGTRQNCGEQFACYFPGVSPSTPSGAGALWRSAPNVEICTQALRIKGNEATAFGRQWFLVMGNLRQGSQSRWDDIWHGLPGIRGPPRGGLPPSRPRADTCRRRAAGGWPAAPEKRAYGRSTLVNLPALTTVAQTRHFTQGPERDTCRKQRPPRGGGAGDVRAAWR